MFRRRKEQENEGHDKEVAFWKSELDKVVMEKNQWTEKYLKVTEEGEMLRAELFLAQREAMAARAQLEIVRRQEECRVLQAANSVVSASGTPRAPGTTGPAHVAGIAASPGASTTCTPLKSTPGAQQVSPVPTGVRAVAALEEQLAAAKTEMGRLQRQLASAEATAHAADMRVAVLEERLAEAGKDVESARRQADFMRTTAEAHFREAETLRAEVMSQRTINDETANETTKILAELSAAQHRCANLASELSIKEQMVGLLQLQLGDILAATGGSASNTACAASAATSLAASLQAGVWPVGAASAAPGAVAPPGSVSLSASGLGMVALSRLAAAAATAQQSGGASRGISRAGTGGGAECSDAAAPPNGVGERPPVKLDSPQQGGKSPVLTGEDSPSRQDARPAATAWQEPEDGAGLPISPANSDGGPASTASPATAASAGTDSRGASGGGSGASGAGAEASAHICVDEARAVNEPKVLLYQEAAMQVELAPAQLSASVLRKSLSKGFAAAAAAATAAPPSSQPAAALQQPQPLALQPTEAAEPLGPVARQEGPVAAAADSPAPPQATAFPVQQPALAAAPAADAARNTATASRASGDGGAGTSGSGHVRAAANRLHHHLHPQQQHATAARATVAAATGKRGFMEPSSALGQDGDERAAKKTPHPALAPREAGALHAAASAVASMPAGRNQEEPLAEAPAKEAAAPAAAEGDSADALAAPPAERSLERLLRTATSVDDTAHVAAHPTAPSAVEAAPRSASDDGLSMSSDAGRACGSPTPPPAPEAAPAADPEHGLAVATTAPPAAAVVALASASGQAEEEEDASSAATSDGAACNGSIERAETCASSATGPAQLNAVVQLSESADAVTASAAAPTNAEEGAALGVAQASDASNAPQALLAAADAPQPSQPVGSAAPAPQSAAAPRAALEPLARNATSSRLPPVPQRQAGGPDGPMGGLSSTVALLKKLNSGSLPSAGPDSGKGSRSQSPGLAPRAEPPVGATGTGLATVSAALRRFNGSAGTAAPSGAAEGSSALPTPSGAHVAASSDEPAAPEQPRRQPSGGVASLLNKFNANTGGGGGARGRGSDTGGPAPPMPQQTVVVPEYGIGWPASRVPASAKIAAMRSAYDKGGKGAA